MVCSQKNLPLSNAATLSCLEPQAMSSNHSPEMRIARASTFFSSSIFCGYKPSSEKQSMMEDSRWSVESVTKQVVNPSLTCIVVKLNCHQVERECLIYHLCRNHRALHLGAWEEVGDQEVAARLSQLTSLLT